MEEGVRERAVKPRKLLIVACARSATMFIARAFCKVGLRLGHEYVGEGGCASHWFARDAAWHSVWTDKKAHVGERRSDYTFEFVWHQVRDPLKVITSNTYTMTRDHRRWLAEVWPQDFAKGRSKLHYAMMYWLLWNQECEAYAQRTYRVEDIDALWSELCAEVGIQSDTVPALDRQMNRPMRWGKPFVDREKIKAAPDLTWNDLEREDAITTDRIRALAASYGYAL